jgi:DNA polymerase-3 subunit delta
MRLRAEEFATHLERALLSVYLLHGEETLLVQECADQLRAACRKQGFSERKIFNADQHFEWRELLLECNSLSLFAERKLIEVRLPSGKPGSAGSAVLTELAALPAGDNVVLILAGKLERDAPRSAWFKAIESHGATAQAWPLRRKELPGWIRARMQKAGFKPTPDAVALLADRVEGNLLAAVQEIEKLALLVEPGAIDAATLMELVTDNARFGIFDLGDRALEGDSAAAIRTLRGLRAEGVEAAVALWTLAEEFRRMLRLARRRADGESMDFAVKAERLIFKPHYESAIRRMGRSGLSAALRRAADVDRCIKGLDRRDYWCELEDLVLLAAKGYSATPSARP